MQSTLDTHSIFRSTPSRERAHVSVRGAVPAWLRGDLVRTAPAGFAQGSWCARHWFDGLGLLYAFRIAGEVRFEQRLLESGARTRILAGHDDTPHFGTPMHRGFFDRLLHPTPRPNDNTNVNIVPLGDQLVAMTETTVQLAVDPATLSVTGPVRYTDSLGGLFMLAHPHADFAKGALVNVASEFGARAGFVVYEHAFASRERKLVARVPMARVPYLHSFGLTPAHAVVLGGPLIVQPWRMLWSDKSFMQHFRWQADEGTALFVVDRATGTVRRHEAPAMFVFHTINTFERGDETVHDVLAYDDAQIVERLSVEHLASAPPDLRAKPTRLVLKRGSVNAVVEPLEDTGFEFPALDYRRSSGAPYSLAWGATNGPGAGGYESALVRLELGKGSQKLAAEPGFVFGEPVFVARPGASREGEGVLLAVASHLTDERAALAVVDALSLEVLAWCEVEASIPLGFHGSFLRAQS